MNGFASSSFYIVTGGPGSGKSTLLAALAKRGYRQSVEAGRAIIRAQSAIGGPALPWANHELFAELMLSWEIRSYEMAKVSSGPMFFDRGVPDVIAYLRLIKVPVPAHIHRAALQIRYAPLVFIAPPWQEIYVQDEERKQNFDEAVRTHESLVSTYTDYGYTLCTLPKEPVESRAEFVISRTQVA